MARGTPPTRSSRASRRALRSAAVTPRPIEAARDASAVGSRASAIYGDSGRRSAAERARGHGPRVTQARGDRRTDSAASPANTLGRGVTAAAAREPRLHSLLLIAGV